MELGARGRIGGVEFEKVKLGFELGLGVVQMGRVRVGVGARGCTGGVEFEKLDTEFAKLWVQVSKVQVQVEFAKVEIKV